MHAIISPPGEEPAGAGASPAMRLHILIVHDTAGACRRAIRLLARIALKFEEDLDIRPRPWTFAEFCAPVWSAQVREEWDRSDVIILATSAGREVPEAVRSKVTQCCDAGMRPGVLLVALADRSLAGQWHRRRAVAFLQGVAARSHVSFLAPSPRLRPLVPAAEA